MDIGISLIMRGAEATRASASVIAAFAEEHGYHSLWVSDHIVIPPIAKTRFPGTPDGEFPPPWRQGYLESISTLAWLAGRTETVRLGTSALVLPLRNPIELAKQLATIDVMSEGRMMVAVTAGYAEDEFDVLHSSFADRGARTEEYVRLLQAVWASDPASFSGEHFAFRDVNVGPLPVQRPRLPVLVGGNTTASIRRAARVGDGWHPSAQGPDQLEPKLDRFHDELSAAGRSAADVPISIKLPFLSFADTATGPGSPAAWVAAFQRFAELGVSLVVLDYEHERLDFAVDTLQRFEREVRPELAV